MSEQKRAQDPKRVHVRQRVCLLIHQTVEPRNGLIVGVCGPKPGMCDFRAQRMERRTKRRGIGSDMADEDLLVILRPPQ